MDVHSFWQSLVPRAREVESKFAGVHCISERSGAAQAMRTPGAVGMVQN
jgi:hypothetical protein